MRRLLTISRKYRVPTAFCLAVEYYIDYCASYRPRASGHFGAHRIPSKRLPNFDTILVRTNIKLVSCAVADPFAYLYHII